MTSSHRIHIPIFSNDKTWFEVGDERRIMHEGEVIEINNTRMHAGMNEGETQRINLLVDYAHSFNPKERLDYFLSLNETSLTLNDSIGINGKLLARPKIDEDKFTLPSYENITKMNAENKVCKLGHVVSFNYEIKNTKSGEIIDSDLTSEPLSVLLGAGQLPYKLEKSFINQKVGNTFQVTLSPEEAYGVLNKKLRTLTDTSNEHKTAESIEVNKNIYLRRNTPHGKFLIQDNNHWFAGIELEISVHIKELRLPTLLEYNYGTYLGASFCIDQNLFI